MQHELHVYKKKLSTHKGFTLLELMLSSALGLFIIASSIQTLFDFTDMEKKLSARNEAVQSATRAIHSIQTMIEMSGYIESDNLSLLTDWNYEKKTDENFEIGEIVQVNPSQKKFMTLRIIGDNYSPFRDCLGSEFSYPVISYITYELTAEQQLICHSKQKNNLSTISENQGVISNNILKLNITNIIYSSQLKKWSTNKATAALVDKTQLKGILVEVLAASTSPLQQDEVSKTFTFFDEIYELATNREVIYKSLLIPLQNQESHNAF